MTPYEIIETAKEAGFFNRSNPYYDVTMVQAFAKLVDEKATAREREACALVSEDCGAIHVAKRIRARGES